MAWSDFNAGANLKDAICWQVEKPHGTICTAIQQYKKMLLGTVHAGDFARND
jgi:hypothetical protein